MSLRSAPLFLLSLLALLGLAACDGGGGGGSSSGSASFETGSTSIFITDGPSDDFDEILVTIEKVALLGQNGPVEIFDGEDTIDLKDLEDFSDLFVHSDDVPVGTYSKIRLRVSRIQLVDGSETIDVDPPANGKLDLNPRGAFQVRRNVNLVIEIDMDANKSIHVIRTGNGDKFKFRPVVFVTIMQTRSPSKLTRVHGRVREIYDNGGFELCSTAFVASREYTSRDEEDRGIGNRFRCMDVETNRDTGVFDENGDPVGDDDLMVGDDATVVGRIHVVDANHDHMMGDGGGAGGDGTSHIDHHQSFVQGDDDEEDDANEVDRYDDDRDRRELVLIAYVIEIGPLGTFLRLAGVVETSVAGDEFDFGVAPHQGFGDSSVLAALLQDGTRIFSRRGRELDDTDVQPGTDAKIDGVLEVDPSGSLLKTALVLLDVTSASDVVRGTIVQRDDPRRRLFINPESGTTECVYVPEGASVLLVHEKDDRSENERAEFDDLYRGLRVHAFGTRTGDASCGFDADSVIGFPERCRDTLDCDVQSFCGKERGECSSIGLCRIRPQLCPLAFIPVCGCDGLTYDNECAANAAGVSVASDGVCSVGLPHCGGATGVVCAEDQLCRTDPGVCDENAAGTCLPRLGVCPPVIAPVCGCNGVTYGNACHASHAGVNIDHEGACDPPIACGGPIFALCPPGQVCQIDDGTCDPSSIGRCVEPPDACIQIYDPVCSCNRGTYANACVAAQAGARVAFRGECRTPPSCGGPLAITCFDDELCMREIGECRATDDGVCVPKPEACPLVLDPVCGCDGVDYSSPCDAHASGVGVAHRGRCDSPQPRCGSIAGLTCPDGQLCVLEEGCISDAFGVCIPTPSSCPDSGGTVCGCDGNDYRNRCEAAVARVQVGSAGSCVPTL